MDIIAIGVANNSGGGGGGTPTDAYSKTETDALLKNKVGFAEYKDNKISLYDSSSKDKVIGEIDLPVDMVVDQIKTKFSQKFKFDSTTYPDTENPNLDGKPVLVLAIKTSATADTFSFLNMESLVDVYTGGTTKSAIISVDPETGVITNVVRISAETGNKIVQKDDGLFVPNQTAADVSYSNTTSKLKATTTQAAIDETLGVANSKYSKPETGIPSTDMTQAVKDSLGKADTALQAADKTELQNKIDEKLNKTAVLSDFSSSELTNKVPSAQLALDSFTKKVTTESANNNTRIITVPENVDCFAGIGMIGGKTQKVVQLLSDKGDRTNGSTVDSDNWFNPQIKSGNTVLLTMSSRTVGKTSTVFSLSSSFDGVYVIHSGKSADFNIYPNEANARIIAGHKYYASYNVKSINTTVANGLVVNDFQIVDLTAMFGSGKEPTASQFNAMFPDYIPYTEGSLWNAPVTDVESVGINVFDEQMELGELNTNTGLPIVSTINLRTINFQKVLPSTKYYLLSAGANANVCFYDTNETFISCTTGVNNSTFTTPSNCRYVKFRLAAAYGLSYKHDVAIIAGETGSYTPYNKTTISIDEIINNLPDYGASVSDEIYNYIDFERGVYVHRVGSYDMSNSNWAENAPGSDVYYATAFPNSKTECKAICDKFTTVKTIPTVAGELYVHNSAFHSSYLCTGIPSMTVSAVREYCKGATIYYELATPEEIPLSSIFPPIHVEPNGTLEFVNEHNLDVPSKTIYKKTV